MLLSSQLDSWWLNCDGDGDVGPLQSTRPTLVEVGPSLRPPHGLRRARHPRPSGLHRRYRWGPVHDEQALGHEPARVRSTRDGRARAHAPSVTVGVRSGCTWSCCATAETSEGAVLERVGSQAEGVRAESKSWLLSSSGLGSLTPIRPRVSTKQRVYRILHAKHPWASKKRDIH